VDNLYEVDAGTIGDKTGGSTAATGLSLILQGKHGSVTIHTTRPTSCAQVAALPPYVVDNV
jgi:hypothetical protein